MSDAEPKVQMMRLQDALGQMGHNRLGNYVVPGLDSWLVGNQGKEHGSVRMFHMRRDSRDIVTPHSHRFDFACLVLAGKVTNTIYREPRFASNVVESWVKSTIGQVCDTDGLRNYLHLREAFPTEYTREVGVYVPGDTYSMKSDEIHSIQFTAGTRVLFFEGPEIAAESVMLEPWVDGKVVPTFRTEDWMFQKDAPT